MADRSQERPLPLSMRDLLASCAAADAVSTPPKAPREHEDREGAADPAEDTADEGRTTRDAA
ncbi:hypothetical protein BLA24_14980 [Streptomyces cinnamoneus]|uniref:Uncharacterized protein n=2 Tax=Streptomyces cinnamoneus TaxID=53446 RepID=A0A2G1XJE1_STRCJ|nr:hypothetical protein BLA24_14980 [Streptomyces cinnamoneus]PPT16532.1 hypothetical protein CYQ11_13090 [Streptomyces cinnamoneus]